MCCYPILLFKQKQLIKNIVVYTHVNVLTVKKMLYIVKQFFHS